MSFVSLSGVQVLQLIRHGGQNLKTFAGLGHMSLSSAGAHAESGMLCLWRYVALSPGLISQAEATSVWSQHCPALQ